MHLKRTRVRERETTQEGEKNERRLKLKSYNIEMHTVDAVKSAYEGGEMKTKKSGKTSKRTNACARKRGRMRENRKYFQRLVVQTRAVERTKRVKIRIRVFENSQVSSFSVPSRSLGIYLPMNKGMIDLDETNRKISNSRQSVWRWIKAKRRTWIDRGLMMMTLTRRKTNHPSTSPRTSDDEEKITEHRQHIQTNERANKLRRVNHPVQLACWLATYVHQS